MREFRFESVLSGEPLVRRVRALLTPEGHRHSSSGVNGDDAGQDVQRLVSRLERLKEALPQLADRVHLSSEVENLRQEGEDLASEDGPMEERSVLFERRTPARPRWNWCGS